MYDIPKPMTKEGSNLKRILSLALCLMVLALPVLALADAAPLAKEDIDQITHSGYETMQDYIDAFQPTEFSWAFEGEATGITTFTMAVQGGSISLSVADAKQYQDDEAGLVGSAKLEGDVLGKPAALTGAYWEDATFEKLSLPRGLKLGDTKDQLQSAIGELEFASLEPGEYEEGYDETASCMLSIGEDDSEWQMHYGFDFYLNEGKLNQAQLWYYTDAE